MSLGGLSRANPRPKMDGFDSVSQKIAFFSPSCSRKTAVRLLLSTVSRLKVGEEELLGGAGWPSGGVYQCTPSDPPSWERLVPHLREKEPHQGPTPPGLGIPANSRPLEWKCTWLEPISQFKVGSPVSPNDSSNELSVTNASADRSFAVMMRIYDGGADVGSHVWHVALMNGRV